MGAVIMIVNRTETAYTLMQTSLYIFKSESMWIWVQITAWWTLRKCHKNFLIILEKIVELLIKGSYMISAVVVTDTRLLTPQYLLFL